MNKVFLIGRVTTDIEVKYTAKTQKAVTRFNLAVNRLKKDDGSDFINCIAWGKTAENMEKYVRKGNKIAIAGRIQTGSYEKDGHKYYTTEVSCEDIEFLETKKSGSDKPEREPVPEFAYVQEDIPF